MVLTDQNNHGREVLSAHYVDVLEETGLSDVDLVTAPPNGEDMSRFAPDFAPAHEARWGERTHGTGDDAPIAHTDQYGQGRVFGTAMGHVDGGAAPGSGPWPAMDCIGFTTLIQRGAEWAAIGKVTQAVPEDFPTALEVNLR